MLQKNEWLVQCLCVASARVVIRLGRAQVVSKIMLMMAAQSGAGHEVLYMSCDRQLYTVYSGYWGEGNVAELSGQEYQRAGLRVLR